MNPKRPLLLPLVPLYGAGMAVRNWFFDIGLFKVSRIGTPVVCVGNIEAGGVGKTPLVELLVRKLAQKGRRVAVVSRGYGRKSRGTVVVSDGVTVFAEASESGDEPAQIAAKLRGTIVVVDEDRARGAELAAKNFGADVVVMDDGFQHRSFHRDLDLVVVPAEHALEPGWLLPAGNRREPVSSLKRATMVALSRCESVEHFHRAKTALGQWTDGPVIGLESRVSAFRRASTRFSVDLGGLKGKSAVAFSGVGNSASFGRTLGSIGLELKRHVAFPDHHDFTLKELTELEESARRLGADFLVTSEKDVARLSGGNEGSKEILERAPVYYAEIEMYVLEGESLLNDAIGKL